MTKREKKEIYKILAQIKRVLREMKTTAHLFSHHLRHCAFTQAAVTVGKTCHSHPHTPGSLHQANSRWLKSNTTLSEALPTHPTQPCTLSHSLLGVHTVAPWEARWSTCWKAWQLSATHPCFHSLTIGVEHVPTPHTPRGQATYKQTLSTCPSPVAFSPWSSKDLELLHLHISRCC